MYFGDCTLTYRPTVNTGIVLKRRELSDASIGEHNGTVSCNAPFDAPPSANKTT